MLNCYTLFTFYFTLQNWSLSTLQTISRRVDETGSAVTHSVGSGMAEVCAAADEHFEHCLNSQWTAGVHH